LFYARTTNEAPELIKKFTGRGGFESLFPLTHMNRHNNKHAGENKTET